MKKNIICGVIIIVAIVCVFGYLIMNNVSTLRKIENDLRRVFVEHDYLEVLMPSFEYVDLYNALDSGIEEEKMSQYINFEGNRVALRTFFSICSCKI